MDEIGLHGADDFAESGIGGNQGIQCLWLATQRDDQPAPALAHFSRQDKQFFFRGFLLRGGSGLTKGKEKKREGTEKSPAPVGSCCSIFHARLPGLLLSILYGSSRSCNELANPKYPRKNGTMARAGKYIHQ